MSVLYYSHARCPFTLAENFEFFKVQAPFLFDVQMPKTLLDFEHDI